MSAKSDANIHRALYRLILAGIAFFVIGEGSPSTVRARGEVINTLASIQERASYDPTTQTQALLYNEARTVYLGNLARRDNGVPPLRWNLQLTHAARWFSWDSTENRPDGFCGHQDTLGGWPDDRALTYGYLGGAGAENAFCGYVSPESAIQGWMNSPGHRGNLLDPNSREIGLGYYRRDTDGRGYVTQGFGNDAVYAPVVIENEAISTTSPNVNLYIYDRWTGGGFAGLAPATQMMVSNDAYFRGVAWEPYNANKSWTLAGGSGWRTVYVKTRDSSNRTLTVSDTIYLGANVPLDELGAAQMSTTKPQVTLYNLDGGALPQVQFSLGWLADDTFGTFGRLWGNGERVTDSAAWGGTAFRLFPGDGEASAWVWDTTFIKDVPLVAYIRLKVNDNSSGNEVARVTIHGGGTEYGPISLRGTDFTAPNQYQEFPLNFTFNSNPDDVFLIFQFWGSGSADVYVDAVSIFTTPQAVTSPLTWSVPGGNYRGQGVWVRYTDGIHFSAITEGTTNPFYTISGNAGVGGAILSYTDGTPQTVVADGSGFYSFTVPYNWSGTVTPSKTYYTFSPPATVYTNIVQDHHNQDYTVTISSFADVPTSHDYWSWIERLYAAGITGGCGTNPLIYCPENPVTRAQMAIFLERGMNGSGFIPPAGTGLVFGDVPGAYWAVNWIEKLALDGITSGCGGGNYCPENPVIRDQMAIFLLRAKYGKTYNPPAAVGVFADVPTDHWAAKWIEQLYAEGITSGCNTVPLMYCPEGEVKRDQMAVFLVRAFNLP